MHKRYLLHVAGYNLGLLMRQPIGGGIRREAAASLALLISARRHDNAGFIAIMLIADGTTILAILILDLRPSPD